jgi:hypothetical protein
MKSRSMFRNAGFSLRESEILLPYLNAEPSAPGVAKGQQGTEERKFFGLGGQRNPLKRLKTAERIQRNASVFLSCTLLGSGRAWLGSAKFGG